MNARQLARIARLRQREANVAAADLARLTGRATMLAGQHAQLVSHRAERSVSSSGADLRACGLFRARIDGAIDVLGAEIDRCERDRARSQAWASQLRVRADRLTDHASDRARQEARTAEARSLARIVSWKR